MTNYINEIVEQDSVLNFLSNFKNDILKEKETRKLNIIISKTNLGASYILKMFSKSISNKYNYINCKKVHSINNFREWFSHIEVGSIVILENAHLLKKVILKWFISYLETNHRDKLMNDIIEKCSFFLVSKYIPDIEIKNMSVIHLDNYSLEGSKSIVLKILDKKHINSDEWKDCIKPLSEFFYNKQDFSSLSNLITSVIKTKLELNISYLNILNFYISNSFLIAEKLVIADLYIISLIFRIQNPTLKDLKKQAGKPQCYLKEKVLKLIEQGFLSYSEDFLKLSKKGLTFAKKMEKFVGHLTLECYIIYY